MNIGKFFLEIIFSSSKFSSVSLSEFDARNAITVVFFQIKDFGREFKEITLIR